MNSRKKNRCVLVFVRAPEKGKVKTRLSRNLNNEIVLHLYKSFAEDVIETVRRGEYNTIICYHPSDAASKITDWLGSAYDIWPQNGKNLGERMAEAFTRAFSAGLKKAILVGTDCPDLEERIIHEAFDALNKNSAVVGPAIDGGYYLIGFNSDSFDTDIFKNMPWGSGHVFQMTVSRLKKKGVTVHLLPQLRDIDTYEDLVAFINSGEKKGTAASNTLKYLSRTNLSGHHALPR